MTNERGISDERSISLSPIYEDNVRKLPEVVVMHILAILMEQNAPFRELDNFRIFVVSTRGFYGGRSKALLA